MKLLNLIDMKKLFRILTVFTLTTLVAVPQMMAGNDNRRGTAGATELLINPWARNSGWGGVNTANARGLDALFTNVAGLSFVEATEVSYTNTMYLGGKRYGASLNTIGLARRLGDQAVLGAYVMTMGLGDIDVTTESSPEAGSNGTFSPSIMNLNVAFAYSFTTSIHGGANIKVISESTADVSATGIGLDAGIQYVTGDNDELKFGIALKNIGPAMSFSGTGMSFSVMNDFGKPITVEYRSSELELPTLLSIGVSYDFLMSKWDQRLTLAGNFTSNAFLRDNFMLGLEYSLLNRFQLRGAFVYQNDIFSATNRTTAQTGIHAGASVAFPFGPEDKGRSFVIDYSFSSASPLRATHAVGASIKF